MNSEKVKEIKEKLKERYYYLDQAYSDHLAYGGKGDEQEEEKIYLLRDILTLINELESENERLNNTEIGELIKENEELEKQCVEWSELNFKKKKQVVELKDRIAELEKENGELKQHITEVEKGIINIARERNKKDELASKFIDSYNDSLKQFAERLKDEIGDMKQFFRSCLDRDYCGLTEDQIDETLKEFIDGEK